MRVILTVARRAGFPLEEAYDLAAATALAYMSDRQAADWWGALKRDRAAWAAAYAAAPDPTRDPNGGVRSGF